MLWYYLASIIWVVILLAWGMKYFAAALQGAAGLPVGLSIFAIVGGLALVGLGITLFVWSLLPGTQGENRYGADPKAEEEARN